MRSDRNKNRMRPHPTRLVGDKKKEARRRRNAKLVGFVFAFKLLRWPRKNELASPDDLVFRRHPAFRQRGPTRKGNKAPSLVENAGRRVGGRCHTFSKTPRRRPASIRLNMAWYGPSSSERATRVQAPRAPEPVARARLPSQSCQKQGTDMHVGYRSRQFEAFVGGAVVEPPTLPQRATHQSHARLSFLLNFTRARRARRCVTALTRDTPAQGAF